MCQECIDNKFEPLSVGCSIDFAKRYIDRNIESEGSEIKFLKRWVDFERSFSKNTNRIYRYVFEKYYPNIHKKYNVVKLLKE